MANAEEWPESLWTALMTLFLMFCGNMIMLVLMPFASLMAGETNRRGT